MMLQKGTMPDIKEAFGLQLTKKFHVKSEINKKFSLKNLGYVVTYFESKLCLT